MANFFLVFLHLFLPFVIFPLGASPFEIPKVVLAEILIELLFLIFLFQGKITLNKSFWLLVAVVLLTLPSLFFTGSPTLFFGNNFRLQGLFLLWNLALFAYLSSHSKVNALLGRLSLISLVAVFISTFFISDSFSGRAVGVLGEPNALASTAIFLWPWVFFTPTIMPPWRKIMIFTAFLGSALIIFMSGSRSGLLAFILQVVFLILALRLKISVFKSTIIVLLLILSSFSLPLLEGGGWFENRAEVWQTSLSAGWARPLLGWGFGNTEEALHTTSLSLNNNVQYQRVDSAHNLFLDWWVQGGALGLAILTGLLVFTLKHLIKRAHVLQLTLLLGIITVMSFNPVSVVTLIHFWWLLGQGMFFETEGKVD